MPRRTMRVRETRRDLLGDDTVLRERCVQGRHLRASMTVHRRPRDARAASARLRHGGNIAARMRRASLGLLVVPTLLAGCADNAMLDVALELPASAIPRYALVDVRPADELDFSSGAWATSAAFPEVRVELDAATTTRVDATVPAENVSRDLLLRVRFCEASPCELDAPASCFVIEEPFHAGRVSTFHGEVRGIPEGPPEPVCSSPPVIVDRCAVGCIEPSRLSGPGADFCTDTGEHTCDR